MKAQHRSRAQPSSRPGTNGEALSGSALVPINALAEANGTAAKHPMSPRSGTGAREDRVILLAIGSRLLVLLLVALFSPFLANYDDSGSMAVPCTSPVRPLRDPLPPLGGREDPPLLWVGDLMGTFRVWDAIHFMQVAKCGYEYENQHAFFPFLPLTARLLYNTVLHPTTALLGEPGTLALAGLLIAHASFIVAALYMFRLSRLILSDDSIAAAAAVLFCLNPASIFHSTIYTEAPYSALTLAGLYYLHRSTGLGDWLRSSALLAGATSVRSNGITNAWFIGHAALQRIVRVLAQPPPKAPHPASPPPSTRRTRSGALSAPIPPPHQQPSLSSSMLLAVLRIVLSAAAQVAIAWAPYVVFEVFGYREMCSGPLKRPWCEGRLPMLYGFVQGHYWKNGLFRYWEARQVPNFLAAAPMLAVSLLGVLAYAGWGTGRLAWLGLVGVAEATRALGLGGLVKRGKAKARRTRGFAGPPAAGDDPEGPLKGLRALAAAMGEDRRKGAGGGGGQVCDEAREPLNAYFSAAAFPFVAHWALLAAVALLTMHVEVATRFLSPAPALYWFGAQLRAGWRGAIWTYFIAYVLVGALMHPNFYPWT